jgi:hypothetical protein
MSEVSTIGLDIAKQVFQMHGADASGHVLLRKRLTRARLIEFFRSQPRCFVALEACGGGHHWVREITVGCERSPLGGGCGRQAAHVQSRAHSGVGRGSSRSRGITSFANRRMLSLASA